LSILASRIAVVIAFAAMALSGCGSIPLSTMARFSAFDEADFASLDATQLRVRVSVPEGYTWDVRDVKLATQVDVGGKARSDTFRLQEIAEGRALRGAGLLSPGKPVHVTTLGLAEASLAAFRDLQGFMDNRKHKRVKLDVQLKLLSAPPDASAMRVWIDVMLSPADGYFTLVDGGSIPLNKTETYGAPKS
jgi:hypothetical protein